MPEINMISLHTDTLDSHVAAGESADRTVRVLWRILTPIQQKHLAYWFAECAKTARQMSLDDEISRFRASVLSEAKRTKTGEPGRVEAPKNNIKSEMTTKALAEEFGL